MTKAALIAGFALAAGILLGDVIADEASPTVPFTQAEFPCQEDEVLGYSPEFGPDTVGCINVEAVR